MKLSDDDFKSIYLADRHSGMESRGENQLDGLIQMGRHVTHRLNNLLTTILANTQLSLLMVRDEEVKSYLKAVEDATRDAEAIVCEFQRSVRTLTKMISQKDTVG